jgi:hypothetical protein
MADDPGAGGAKPPRPTVGLRPRRICGCRRTASCARAGTAGPAACTAGGCLPLSAAVSAVNRFRVASGALITAGVTDEPTPVWILAELVDALIVRSKLPPVHPFRTSITARAPAPDAPARPAGWAGGYAWCPSGKLVPFAGGGAARVAGRQRSACSEGIPVARSCLDGALSGSLGTWRSGRACREGGTPAPS